MDDLSADVDRCSEGFESDFDDIDGANDSGTEATGLKQQDAFLDGGIDVLVAGRGGSRNRL